jgi:endonuclease/exonuclease/phosphatase family metal-dependent hydrolase
VRHLTVVSYNIHRGVGLDRRRDLDRIADVIGEDGYVLDHLVVGGSTVTSFVERGLL